MTYLWNKVLASNSFSFLPFMLASISRKFYDLNCNCFFLQLSYLELALYMQKAFFKQRAILPLPHLKMYLMFYFIQTNTIFCTVFSVRNKSKTNWVKFWAPGIWNRLSFSLSFHFQFINRQGVARQLYKHHCPSIESMIKS